MAAAAGKEARVPGVPAPWLSQLSVRVVVGVGAVLGLLLGVAYSVAGMRSSSRPPEPAVDAARPELARGQLQPAKPTAMAVPTPEADPVPEAGPAPTAALDPVSSRLAATTPAPRPDDPLPREPSLAASAAEPACSDAAESNQLAAGRGPTDPTRRAGEPAATAGGRSGTGADGGLHLPALPRRVPRARGAGRTASSMPRLLSGDHRAADGAAGAIDATDCWVVAPCAARS